MGLAARGKDAFDGIDFDIVFIVDTETGNPGNKLIFGYINAVFVYNRSYLWFKFPKLKQIFEKNPKEVW